MIFSVVWIGWHFDVRTCTFYLEPEKLLESCRRLRLSLALLPRLTGKLLWLVCFDQCLTSVSLPLPCCMMQLNASPILVPSSFGFGTSDLVPRPRRLKLKDCVPCRVGCPRASHSSKLALVGVSQSECGERVCSPKMLELTKIVFELNGQDVLARSYWTRIARGWREGPQKPLRIISFPFSNRARPYEVLLQARCQICQFGHMLAHVGMFFVCVVATAHRLLPPKWGRGIKRADPTWFTELFLLSLSWKQFCERAALEDSHPGCEN